MLYGFTKTKKATAGQWLYLSLLTWTVPVDYTEALKRWIFQYTNQFLAAFESFSSKSPELYARVECEHYVHRHLVYKTSLPVTTCDLNHGCYKSFIIKASPQSSPKLESRSCQSKADAVRAKFNNCVSPTMISQNPGISMRGGMFFARTRWRRSLCCLKRNRSKYTWC